MVSLSGAISPSRLLVLTSPVLSPYYQLVRSTMRLYKPKVLPTQHRPLDSSPPTTSLDRLKRATEAVGKQLSGHKAMLAQFKELRLPRPLTFSTKPGIAPQSERSESPFTKSKAAKISGKLPISPERSPISKAPAAVAAHKSRASLSDACTTPRTPTKPPSFWTEKPTSSVRKASTPRAALSQPESPPCPNRRSPQKARTTTAPVECPPATADLSCVPVTSTSRQVDLNEHILTVPCFPSLAEDSELEFDLNQPLLPASCFRSLDDDSMSNSDSEFDLEFDVDLSADFESQVAQIFSVGLGSTSETESVRYHEITPPRTPQEISLAPTLEPLSAVVEMWDSALESKISTELKATPRRDRNTVNEAATPMDSSHGLGLGLGLASIPIPWRVHTLSRPARSNATTLPRQPLSSTDYEYVAYLGKGAFGAVALAVHKKNQRLCAVKIISKAIVEEQNLIRDILAEQRIMREASSHPFLLGLLASFHNAHAFYLVSEYCRSTLFDERHYMPESDKNLASAELACAVDHLHGLGIIHRDIKLENVMMRNDGHIVLGDFGLAYRLRAPRSPVWRVSLSARADRNNTINRMAHGVCGTLPYMAPEILCNLDYSYGVDWFAYGVLLHVFYLNKFPWLGEHEQPASYLQQMMSTLSAGLIFENRSFGALLNRLFCVDQDARADFSIVRRAAFFANINWQNVIAMSSSPSHLPQGRGRRLRPMLVDEVPSLFEDFSRFSVREDSYPNFTWLSPSMTVEEVTPDLSYTDSSFGSSPVVPSTPSEFSSSYRYPLREKLQVLNTPPLSPPQVCIEESVSPGCGRR
ncbi:kinase-like domain-containing protein [Lactifluus volemus]|nr:kinase-like domain-containing protein [Lactifluus volemus]